MLLHRLYGRQSSGRQINRAAVKCGDKKYPNSNTDKFCRPNIRLYSPHSWYVAQITAHHFYNNPLSLSHSPFTLLDQYC